MCGIERQPPTVPHYLQCPGLMLVDTPGFDDSIDDQALLSHIESCLNMLPSATNGVIWLMRKDICSLQKVVQYVEGTIREYDECKDRNGIGDLLRDLDIALNELKECAATHGPNSGYMPHCNEYEKGTHMERQGTLPYEPLQSFQRCIGKAIERARVKINRSTRRDSEWHTLEKYSPSASYTQPRLGKGAQSAVYSESICRHLDQPSGRDLRVFELSCLIMGKTICPLLLWLFLQSLKAEPPSILDRSLLNLFPSLLQTVTILGRHHTITLSMCLVSTSLAALALFIPLSHISESCRTPVFFCCWLALVVSGPLWTHTGGSAASFFLVFMPYAMSVGISLGLCWCRCVTRREFQIVVARDELQREASSSKVAEPS